MLDELENGWYLRSYEHMTSKLHFQKVGALKACRSIEFGRAITFVHIFNGSQDEIRTYTPVENLTSLKAENAKLRELVRDMWNDGMCCCDEQYTCAECCEYHYHERMKALGIEVD